MLHDELKNLNKYPFHMPGHKRNGKFGIAGSDIDITEIVGFDDLHEPKGTIAQVEEIYQKLYNSKSSVLLVNGSTVGILAAVFAMTHYGDKVIVAANCHKSVYNACALRKLKTIIANPRFDGVNGIYTRLTQDEVDRVIKLHPDAKLLIFTSPTYEGYTSEIKTDLPVIVDAAHGAHLPFFEETLKYPKGNIVISSLHKTLPALTQTAIANIYDTNYIRPFRHYIDTFETSSPSYVLMNSASICAEFLNNRAEEFQTLQTALRQFYRMTELKHLKLLISDDISKINISTAGTNISGIELGNILRNEYGFECEAANLRHVILMATVGDDFTVYEKLSGVLKEIDGRLKSTVIKPIPCRIFNDEEYDFSLEPADSEFVELNKSNGRICAEFVYAYPPGIPILFPNALITSETIHMISDLMNHGVNLTSTGKLLPRSILTKKE